MIRLYLVLICLLLSSCGGSSATKPTLLWNAESYTDDAMQAYADEDWVKSQRLFIRALSLYQGIDDRLAVLACHINLVEVALAVHDNQAANKHLSLAADIVKADALKNYQPRITLLYAQVAMQQNKMTEAAGFLQEILPAFKGEEAVAMPDAIQLVAIVSRTEIAFVQKQDESLWTHRYANILKKSVNKNADLEARLLRFQSSLFFQQGDYDQAAAYLQEALLIYKNNHSRTGIAGTLLELGGIYEKQSDWQRALNYFNRSLAVFRSLGNAEKVNQVAKNLLKVETELAESDK